MLGHNPANWMLEVTAPGVEKSMGLDFAQLYRESPLNAKNQAQVDAECLPPPDNPECLAATRQPERLA